MRHLIIIRIVVIALMEIAVLGLGLNGMLSGVWEFSKDPIISYLPMLNRRGAVAVTPENAVEPLPGVRPEPSVSAIDVYPGIRAYWAALFLLPILHWATLLAIRQRRRSIPIKTSSSETISIYQSAITQFVGSALGEIPAIIGHRVRVKRVRDGLGLRIFVRLRPVDHIPTVQAQIEDVVRRRVTELLGLEKIYEISVDVEGFGKLKRQPEEIHRPIPIQERPETGESAPADTTGLAKPGDEVVLRAPEDEVEWRNAHDEHREEEEITLQRPEGQGESARIVSASDQEGEPGERTEHERER